ncbi:MAG TPA: glucosaminidase domain-containing protein [Micromonosporaceae bacterium]|nr:glucosaminidase domain-containing protein [Micromonosporaceae bacterium]
MLALQRFAGNAAVAEALQPVRRCGGSELAEYSGRGLLALQRAARTQAAVQALSAQLQRQTDPLADKKRAYYDRVAMLIVELSQREGMSLEKAMILIAQAQVEQGLDDPAKNNNRLFNAQATWAEEKALKAAPQRGMRTERIPSPEQQPDGSMRTKVSPFFVYDSLEESINHHFRRLAQRYREALKVLHDPKGTAAAYARALKRRGYATAHNYVSAVTTQHGIVVRDFTGFLHARRDLERQNVAKGQTALGVQWRAVRRQWDILNDLKRQRAGSPDPAAATAVDLRIRDAERKLAEQEATLKEIEQYLKNRETQLNKLESLVGQADAIAASMKL